MWFFLHNWKNFAYSIFTQSIFSHVHVNTNELFSFEASHLYQLGSNPHRNLPKVFILVQNLSLWYCIKTKKNVINENIKLINLKPFPNMLTIAILTYLHESYLHVPCLKTTTRQKILQLCLFICKIFLTWYMHFHDSLFLYLVLKLFKLI